MWNSPKVGVLGGGQLGRMLVESANRLNIQMNVLDVENAPAKQISSHDGHVVGSFKDPEAVRKLAQSSDVLTAEIEHVDTYALEEVAGEVKVEPSWEAIRIIQNKYNQKKHLSKFGIPMADYLELVKNTPEELAEIGEKLGYPLMLKSKTLAYDGRGELICCSRILLYSEIQYAYNDIRKLRCPLKRGYSRCSGSAQGPTLVCREVGSFQDGSHQTFSPINGVF